jgi:ABC-type branched-subunit amino acid transport system substrate-binding protein
MPWSRIIGWDRVGGSVVGCRTRLRALAAALGVAIAVAACSGGGDEAGPAGPPKAADARPGTPVKLMTIAPTGTPGANAPEAVAAASAAVRAVNARGGIKGHPVKLIHCNEKNAAAAAAACAKRAVDEGVLAVVGVFNGSGGIMPVLAEAGIPAIGATGIAADGTELTSKVSFMLSPLTFFPAACPSVLRKAGATKIGLVGYDLSLSDRLIKLGEVGAKAAGSPLDPLVRVPLTTSDLTPAVSRLTRAGADGVVLVAFAQTAYAVIERGGADLLYCHAASTLDEKFLAAHGPAADNLVVATAFPEFNQAGEFPELRRMIAELAAEEKAGNRDAALASATTTHSINAWLSVQVVEKVGDAVPGEPSASTLLAQLGATSGLDLGVIGPLNFTKPNPLPGVERVFNTTLRGARWNSAKRAFVSLGPETYSALEILRRGQSAG